MKKVIFFNILIVALLLGCEDVLQKGDEIVRGLDAAAGGTQAVLESPAGQMIPPDLKLYGLLGIGLANGLVIAWEEWRNKQMKKTTRAIVKGIDRTSNPDLALANTEVKANIADEMRRQGGDKFYARANKIVDRLKVS